MIWRTAAITSTRPINGKAVQNVEKKVAADATKEVNALFDIPAGKNLLLSRRMWNQRDSIEIRSIFLRISSYCNRQKF
jgi:hypothetical protein